MNQQRIILKNNLSEIETMALAIEAFGQTQDLPLRVVFDMNLVLEEIVTNIISYGYEDELEHNIEVDVAWDKDIVTIKVTDDAKQFDPLAQPEPDLLVPLEQREAGGLGIYFIKQRMDEVVYKWEQGHNVLEMRKNYAKEMQK